MTTEPLRRRWGAAAAILVAGAVALTVGALSLRGETAATRPRPTGQRPEVASDSLAARISAVQLRLRFPHKTFMLNQIRFRQSEKPVPFAGPLRPDGTVLIELPASTSPFDIAHEIGHAAATLLLDAKGHRALLRAMHQRDQGRCLKRSANTYVPYLCDYEEEFAQAFAISFHGGRAPAGRLGRRLPPARFRDMFLRHASPQLAAKES